MIVSKTNWIYPSRKREKKKAPGENEKQPPLSATITHHSPLRDHGINNLKQLSDLEKLPVK